MTTKLHKKTIRQTMRATRRALSLADQERAAQQLLQQALQSSVLKQFDHLGVYLCEQQELSLQPLIEWCWQQGKHTYLPVITAENSLEFFSYDASTSLQQNRFGIYEPVSSNMTSTPISQLQCVLLPLVAFDNSGRRLGMGGGFYDRTFAQQHTAQLIGIAYDFQQCDELPRDEWDVNLDAVMTPTRIHFFSS